MAIGLTADSTYWIVFGGIGYKPMVTDTDDQSGWTIGKVAVKTSGAWSNSDTSNLAGTIPVEIWASSPDTATIGLIDTVGTAVTVKFGAASYIATEGGTSATVAVTLSADPERTVTVPLAVTRAVGATTSDYTLLPASLTFTAGQTRRTFTVRADDDSADDDGESIMVGFGELPSGVTPGSLATATVNLADNDDPSVTVQFGAASYTATEDGTAARVEVTLSADPERTVDVLLNVTPAGGATTADYTLLSESLTFRSGQTSATFTVTAVDDSADDDGESITVGFGGLPSGVTHGSPATATVKLTDNDHPAVTMQFGAASYIATEGGMAATVEVTLSADPERAVDVQLVVTSAVGATPPDYTLSPSSLTFGLGQQKSSTFIVTAFDDSNDDDDESITIGFGTLPSGVTAASPDTTTVTLIDNDVTPVTPVTPVTVKFGAGPYTATEGGLAATVEVTLSADPGRTVIVQLDATEAGGATPADYTLLPASLTFGAGQKSATFTVAAVDDSADDDGESIMVGFVGLPSGVTAASPDTATVNLVDDDDPAVTPVTPVTVKFGAGSYTATEGGLAVTVAVTLSAAPGRTVIVPLAVTRAGGATTADYTPFPASLTFLSDQTSRTFTVTAQDDGIDDDGESITIGFGELPSGVTAAIPTTATVDLADNDGPDVTVQFGAASYTATEGGLAATVEVTLSADPERTVIVLLNVTPAGGATVDDYRLDSESLEFVSGQTSATFLVTAVEDSDDDDGESVTFGLLFLSKGVTPGSPATAMVNLTDNDGPDVTAQFGAGPYTATEGGLAATVEVTLSADPERTVIVDLDVTEAGGATTDDYTLVPESLTFRSGQTSATFTVTAANDSADEDGESIMVGFGGLPSGVTAASPDTATVNLADNDETAVTPVTVQFGSAAYTATEGGTAATVAVTLSADPGRTVIVQLDATEAGGATPADYTLLPSSLTFGPRQTRATFTVTAVDDSDNDDGESITVGFGTLPSGVTAASPDTTTVNLADNDEPAIASRIVSYRVTSVPIDGSWYGPGEQIQFTIGFSLPVTVVGAPELGFNVDTPALQKERASYLSGSGSNMLVFSYTVGTDYDDTSGISWKARSLHLVAGVDKIIGLHNSLDADLRHNSHVPISGHRIDQNPRLVWYEMTSNPAHGTDSDTYGAGDVITIELVFNQTVTATGAAEVPFNLNSGRAAAAYVRGNGTTTLVFSYTVLAADADDNGIYLFSVPFTTGSVVGVANNLPAVNQIADAGGPRPGHKVDGTIGGALPRAVTAASQATATVYLPDNNQNPRMVSYEVTSDPVHGTDSDTYGAGDAITIELVFNQTVTATGAAEVRFNLNSGRAAAAYVRGSGTNTLVFSYAVPRSRLRRQRHLPLLHPVHHRLHRRRRQQSARRQPDSSRWRAATGPQGRRHHHQLDGRWCRRREPAGL